MFRILHLEQIWVVANLGGKKFVEFFVRIWNWQSCAKAYKAYKRPVLTRAISKSLKCRGVWCRHKLVYGDWNWLIYGVRDDLFIFQMAYYQFFMAMLGYTCFSAHWKMRHINESGFRITSLEGGFLFHRWSQLVTWGWWCRHRYLWIIIAVYHFICWTLWVKYMWLANQARKLVLKHFLSTIQTRNRLTPLACFLCQENSRQHLATRGEAGIAGPGTSQSEIRDFSWFASSKLDFNLVMIIYTYSCNFKESFVKQSSCHSNVMWYVIYYNDMRYDMKWYKW